MLIWRILVELFTNFGDYGLPHIPLFIVLFSALTFLQVLSLKKGRGVVKFLPLIISASLSLFLQLLVWTVAYIMHSYAGLLIVVALTYLVVAVLGAIFGIVVFLLMNFIQKSRKN